MAKYTLPFIVFQQTMLLHFVELYLMDLTQPLTD